MAKSSYPSPASLGLFVIEGEIGELHVERGRQNLLAKIDKHYQSSSAVIAATASVIGQSGLFANAANLALYDGEATTNFACLIGDKLVGGQFAGAQILQTGRTVKAVVSRHGDTYQAHAILEEDRGLLWTSIREGSKADTKAHIAIGKWSGLFILLFLIGFALIMGGISEKTADFCLMGTLIDVGTMSLMALWCSRDTKVIVGPATAAFELLGFADPERIDLVDFQFWWITDEGKTVEEWKKTKYRRGDFDQYRDVFCYKMAIEAGKLAFADPERQAAAKAKEISVIEGVVADLHVAQGKEALLQKLAARAEEKNGKSASAPDPFATLLKATRSPLKDVEHAHNFACLVGDHLVCGQLSGARFLKPGHRVRAAITQEGDLYQAHAILDEEEGLLWSPTRYVPRLKRPGTFRRWLAVVCAASLATIAGLMHQEGIVQGTAVFGGLSALYFLLIYPFGVSSKMALPRFETRLFQALGFDLRQDIFLRDYNVHDVDRQGKSFQKCKKLEYGSQPEKEVQDMYRYRLAIERGALKMAPAVRSRAIGNT